MLLLSPSRQYHWGPTITYTQLLEKIKNKEIVIDICSNPEFLKEGGAVMDFMRPDRIIIGSDSERVKTAMTALYERLNRQVNKLILCPFLQQNYLNMLLTLLATKISFVNELSHIAEKIGANMRNLKRNGF